LRCSQRSELEQQLADSRAMCSNKQRELDLKRQLIAQGEQQLQQKDELIKLETQRLEDAKMRRSRCAAHSSAASALALTSAVTRNARAG
jgi:hypothetical protein